MAPTLTTSHPSRTLSNPNPNPNPNQEVPSQQAAPVAIQANAQAHATRLGQRASPRRSARNRGKQ